MSFMGDPVQTPLKHFPSLIYASFSLHNLLFCNFLLPTAHTSITMAREGTQQNVVLRKGGKKITWPQKMPMICVDP
jgi:hypothetical protein